MIPILALTTYLYLGCVNACGAVLNGGRDLDTTFDRGINGLQRLCTAFDYTAHRNSRPSANMNAQLQDASACWADQATTLARPSSPPWVPCGSAPTSLTSCVSLELVP